MTSLGRIPGPSDSRDRDYPMALRLVAAAAPPKSRYWYPGQATLDQGSLGACVGFTGANWMQNSPVRDKVGNQTGIDLYRACKQIDGIPDVEGTYARALLKVLQGQGRVGRYLWAQNPTDIKNWVLTTGPVMVGTAWTESMFTPDANGYLTVAGNEVGGHEYLIRGYSADRDAYLCRNSWGADWGIHKGSSWYGRGGEFLLKRADLEKLVFQMWGDAIGVDEVPVR